MANHTILIVDYEPRGVDQLREPLESLGFTVAVASDGVEGESAHRDLSPALTFVEVMLPKRSGLDLCRDLKNSGTTSPIVVMTSRFAAKRYRKLAIAEYHADQFLEKPIEPEDLHVVLNQLVSVARAASGSAGEAAPQAATPGEPAPNGQSAPVVAAPEALDSDAPIDLTTPIEIDPPSIAADAAPAPWPAPTPPAPTPPAPTPTAPTPPAPVQAAPAPPAPIPAAPAPAAPPSRPAPGADSAPASASSASAPTKAAEPAEGGGDEAAEDIESRIDELLSDPFGSD